MPPEASPPGAPNSSTPAVPVCSNAALELPPPFRLSVPRMTATSPVLVSDVSILAIPSAPSTAMVPALTKLAAPMPMALRSWPLGSIARLPVAVFSSVPVDRISAPPVHDIRESLVSVPAVSAPPAMTKSPAMSVRLATVSVPASCRTCGSSTKSMTASLPEPGAVPPDQRVGSSKSPAPSIDQAQPAIWNGVPLSSNTVPSALAPPAFVVPNRSPAASAISVDFGDTPFRPVKLNTTVGVLA